MMKTLLKCELKHKNAQNVIFKKYMYVSNMSIKMSIKNLLHLTPNLLHFEGPSPASASVHYHMYGGRRRCLHLTL